jgi:hypothetical protein
MGSLLEALRRNVAGSDVFERRDAALNNNTIAQHMVLASLRLVWHEFCGTTLASYTCWTYKRPSTRKYDMSFKPAMNEK